MEHSLDVPTDLVGACSLVNSKQRNQQKKIDK